MYRAETPAKVGCILDDSDGDDDDGDDDDGGGDDDDTMERDFRMTLHTDNISFYTWSLWIEVPIGFALGWGPSPGGIFTDMENNLCETSSKGGRLVKGVNDTLQGSRSDM